MADYASESGHWYQKDGTPCYSIVGKNGKERPTTLRDARTMNLVPSVTTILSVAAKPGLINWMVDQGILAALTMPRLENEPEETYIARIKADSKEQAKKAAERGTQIHGWVEKGFLGLEVGEGMPFYESARKTLLEACGEVVWKAEKSFATDRYGGKVDLHSDRHVIDFKTTDKDLSTIKTWDEHAMQLSAYDAGLAVGIHLPRSCGILYINTKTAESKLIWVEEKELLKGWKCFNALLDFWYAKHGLGV
jgi:hypothetical protein